MCVCIYVMYIYICYISIYTYIHILHQDLGPLRPGDVFNGEGAVPVEDTDFSFSFSIIHLHQSMHHFDVQSYGSWMIWPRFLHDIRSENHETCWICFRKSCSPSVRNCNFVTDTLDKAIIWLVLASENLTMLDGSQSQPQYLLGGTTAPF